MKKIHQRSKENFSFTVCGCEVASAHVKVQPPAPYADGVPVTCPDCLAGKLNKRSLRARYNLKPVNA